MIPFCLRAEKVTTGQDVHWLVVFTEFYKDNIVLIKTFGTTVLGVVTPICTFLIVFAATIVTVIKLRLALEWRGKTSSKARDIHKHHIALTSMLLIVSCINIVTMMPYVAREVVQLIIQEFSSVGRFSDLFLAVSAAVHICPRINSSVHFFVFLFRSSRYRQVLFSSIKNVRHGRTPAKKLTSNEPVTSLHVSV